VAEVVDGRISYDQSGERRHPPLPGGVEQRFVMLDRNPSEAMHAAHVVHPIHRLILARTVRVQ
jgi:hypothetical protein